MSANIPPSAGELARLMGGALRGADGFWFVAMGEHTVCAAQVGVAGSFSY